ncbi:hypothetical protein [Burkholderia ubonensis]|uniref:hypothetical protein n=1 Tax=Burkholderia ubonensis TaxID=101571 RepID=UPI0016287AE1|nr:hypothetical protein [Burkholderia ubonensis]
MKEIATFTHIKVCGFGGFLYGDMLDFFCGGFLRGGSPIVSEAFVVESERIPSTWGNVDWTSMKLDGELRVAQGNRTKCVNR